MKRITIAAIVLLVPMLARADEPTLDRLTFNIPPTFALPLDASCDPEGVEMVVSAGGSIAGPFEITTAKNWRKDQDGTIHMDTQDVLSVQAGQTFSGPIKLCTRPVKAAP